MKWLACLLSIFTGPREKVEIEWSDSWVYNLFRLYELVFWRKIGIRLEATTDISSAGDEIKTFYTWEALICHFAGLFKLPKLYLVKNYVLAYQGISPKTSMRPKGYVFAIGFDAASGAQNVGTSTTISVSHTVTGSNPLLVGGYHGALQTVVVSGIQWNSAENYVKINAVTENSRNTEAWYLKAPTTGTHSNIWTLGSTPVNWSATAASYSGVDQTTPLDVSTTANVIGTTMTLTVTTTVDNDWLIGVIATGGGSLTAGASTTFRGSIQVNPDQVTAADSNGSKSPTGSYSLIATDAGGGGNSGGIMGAFKPAAGGATTTAFLSLLGIGS